MHPNLHGEGSPSSLQNVPLESPQLDNGLHQYITKGRRVVLLTPQPGLRGKERMNPAYEAECNQYRKVYLANKDAHIVNLITSAQKIEQTGTQSAALLSTLGNIRFV